MKAIVIDPLTVAEEVGAANKNPTLTAQLKLFLTAVDQCGFKFVKEVKDEGE